MLTPFTIITAADAKFFTPLQNLLWTAAQCEPKTNMVVWDIGMTAAQLADLKTSYPSLDVRIFDFTKYPAYFNMASNDGRIAFRPAILSQAAAEFGGFILWLDASAILDAPLHSLRVILKKNGIYAKPQNSACKTCLNPAAAKDMGASDTVLSQPLRRPGVFGFDCGNPAAKDLIDRWLAAALNPAVTNPADYDRKGRHSHESAVFSVLIHQSKIPFVFDDSDIRITAPVTGRTLRDVQFRRGFKSLSEYRKWRAAK